MNKDLFARPPGVESLRSLGSQRSRVFTPRRVLWSILLSPIVFAIDWLTLSRPSAGLTWALVMAVMAALSAAIIASYLPDGSGTRSAGSPCGVMAILFVPVSWLSLSGATDIGTALISIGFLGYGVMLRAALIGCAIPGANR